MGLIARVLEFIRTTREGDELAEVKCDPGTGANEHGQLFQPAGFDAQPLPQDAAFLSEANGIEIAVGFADTNTPGESGPGEAQQYGRNSSGVRVCRVWTKNDGKVMITNESGLFEMAPNGNVTINGVTIDTEGRITAAEVTAGGVALSAHVHAYVDSPAGASVTDGPQAPEVSP